MAKDDPKKIIKEVGDLSTQISRDISSLSATLNAEAQRIATALGTSANSYRDNLNSVKDLSKSLAGINEKSLKSSRERSSIETKILNTQKEITRLERLKSSILREATTATAARRRELLKITNLLEKGIEYSKDQIDATEKLKKLYIDIERNLGLTGKLLEGINKIPILNKFLDVKKAIAEANEEAAKFTGNRWSVFAVAIKSLGKSLITNLTDPLTLLTAAGGALSIMYRFFTDFDKRAVSIGRHFGALPSSARQTAIELKQIAASSGDLLSTTGNLTEAFMALNDIAGTYANFGKETLETYNGLVKGLGLSKEAVEAQYKISVLQNKTFKQTTIDLAGRLAVSKSINKLAISDKEIYESIAKTTALQRINLRGSNQQLIDSVVNVKKLGASFEDLKSISSSLLQFETSISSELEAELLTGKQLNLERARAAALSNDQAALAAEIATQVGTASEFGQKNVIQQEALANAFGLSAERMAEMLENQELLNAANKLGAKDVSDLARQYALAADKEAFLARIGDDRLKSQVQNITFQEKLNNLVEKLKDYFVVYLEPVFAKLLNKFDAFVRNGGLKTLAETAKDVANFAVTIGKALVGPVGKILLGLGALAALRTLVTGIPVRIVGAGGGMGGGGGLMSSFYQSGTAGTPGKFYKGGQFTPGGGRAPAGGIMVGGTPGTKGKLTGMGAGAIGLGATIAGEAIGGNAGNLLSSAGQGAMLGSIAGPWGALVGAVGGLALSGLSILKKSEEERLNKESAAKLEADPYMAQSRRLQENQAKADEIISRYNSITGVSSDDRNLRVLEDISSKLSNVSVVKIDENKLVNVVADRSSYQQETTQGRNV